MYNVINNFKSYLLLEPPDPPVNLEVIEVGSRAVRLSWRPPFDGHSKLLGYTVQYKASPPSSDWQHANTLNLSTTAVEAGSLAVGYCTHSLFLALVL
jgi:hypothetical protein